MPTRRIYVPLTHEQVRELAAERLLAAPLQGYAAGSPGRVDARLAPAASQEEAEHLAFLAAAGHAARLDEGARRVIASADAPEDTIREVPGTASGPVPVVVAEDLPLRAIASLHIDEAVTEVGDDVDEAVDESDTEQDLLWYDITELDTVVDELDR